MGLARELADNFADFLLDCVCVTDSRGSQTDFISFSSWDFSEVESSKDFDAIDLEALLERVILEVANRLV